MSEIVKKMDREVLDEIHGMLLEILPFVQTMASLAAPMLGGGGGIKGAAVRAVVPTDVKAAVAAAQARAAAAR
jgi:hypothetical protein